MLYWGITLPLNHLDQLIRAGSTNADLIGETNTLAAFILNRLVADPKSYVTLTDIAAAYAIFLEDEGVIDKNRKVAKNQLFAHVKQCVDETLRLSIPIVIERIREKDIGDGRSGRPLVMRGKATE